MPNEIRFPALSLTITKLLIIIGIICAISGLAFYIVYTNIQLSQRQSATATANALSTTIALVKATSVTEVQNTATRQAQATATAQTQAASTAQVQASAIVKMQATVIAQELSTAVAAAEATAAAKAHTAVAAHEKATAIIRARITSTALAQANSTAQARATATAEAQNTAVARSLSATVVAAKETAAAEVWATVSAQAEATAIARNQSGYWLIFEIQSVTVLADKSDGLDGEMELWMYTIITDGEISTQLSYPNEDGAVQVSTGQTIPMGQYALAIDERSIGNELGIYITALDSDNPLDEAILRGIVEEALEQAFLGLAKKYNKTFNKLLPEAVSGLVDWVYLYFDLIAQDTIILKRSEEWTTGQKIKYRTRDGGLEIYYQVYLTDKLPSDIEWER